MSNGVSNALRVLKECSGGDAPALRRRSGGDAAALRRRSGGDAASRPSGRTIRPAERGIARCNALLTRRVTGVINGAPTQPNPTQPISVVAVVFPPRDSNSIHRYGSIAGRRIGMAADAARFGGVR